MIRKVVKHIPGARRLAVALGLINVDADPRRFLLDMLPKHSVGAEIGVHTGDFSSSLLEALNPQRLHLIDPWKYESSPAYENSLYGDAGARNGQAEMDQRYRQVNRRFKRQISSGRVSIHRGYSAEILNEFADGFFDWVYIDGNHLYEYVKSDLELALRKTRSDGIIAGDDYDDPGWWQGGVKKAVDEFAENNSVELLVTRNNQFVFRKVLARKSHR